MRGPKPLVIELTDTERQALGSVARRHSTPQQIALRARIILAADAGQNNTQIARQEGVGVDMVRLWRRRWRELEPTKSEDLSVFDRLSDRPRPGAPRRITAEQVCQMMAMACEAPEASGRPISQWTGREIASTLRLK